MALRPIMQLKLLCIMHLGLYRCQKQPTNFSEEANFLTQKNLCELCALARLYKFFTLAEAQGAQRVLNCY